MFINGVIYYWSFINGIVFKKRMGSVYLLNIDCLGIKTSLNFNAEYGSLLYIFCIYNLGLLI